MQFKPVNVGDIIRREECVNGIIVIMIYKVIQIKPVYREEKIGEEQTDRKCS